jgi:drug/metabolite transporter (DMT)-like permease
VVEKSWNSSLGFILPMILGKFIMGDQVSAARLLGTLFISAGVVLVAKG